MKVFTSPIDLRAEIVKARAAGQSVGFVPTMGYLHVGHIELIRTSTSENDTTVLSIFVNPSQFGPNEDLDRYPRDMPRDLSIAETGSVDIVFTPDDETMYPDGSGGQEIWVDPGNLGNVLEGAHRPGHFRGVTTVVTKLLHLVQPDRLYLGQKDAQQAIVLSRMVRDLAFDITVRVVPTIRESDGLALSSRNVYLNPQERGQAVVLSQALMAAQQAFESGEGSGERLVAMVSEKIRAEAPLGRIDYVALVDSLSLAPIMGNVEASALLCVAVWFGGTRLIDNSILERGESTSEAHLKTAGQQPGITAAS